MDGGNMGGEHFDNIEDGIFEVKAVAGDPHLGVEDFGNRIVDSSLQGIKRVHRGKDITQDTLFVGSLSEGIDGSCSLYHVRFVELNMDVFRNARHLVGSVYIKGVGDVVHYTLARKLFEPLPPGNVHEGAIVGGSTRVPRVRVMIREFSNGISVS